MKAEKRILLIKDDHEQALLFKQLLSLSVENECQITHKDTLAHSLEYLRKNTPNAILLDLDLSDNRGLEALDKYSEPQCQDHKMTKLRWKNRSSD